MLVRNKGFTVGRGESVRAKITTTIEEALLNKAKALAKQEGLSGANALLKGLWSCILPVFNVKCGKNRCPAAG